MIILWRHIFPLAAKSQNAALKAIVEVVGGQLELLAFDEPEPEWNETLSKEQLAEIDQALAEFEKLAHGLRAEVAKIQAASQCLYDLNQLDCELLVKQYLWLAKHPDEDEALGLCGLVDSLFTALEIPNPLEKSQ